MRTRAVCFVFAVAILAAPASATESTIVPGVGIGKIRMGMTLAQVERVFGKDAIVNSRRNVAGTQYVEYGWNFSTWSVGFLQSGATLKATQVATTLRGQRTSDGIGVGSTFKAVARAYPRAICASYYPSMGSIATTQPGNGSRGYGPAIVVAKDRKQMAFMVTNPDLGLAVKTKPWYVNEVVVRNSVPGAVDFVPDGRCQPGWQQRGAPYR
jgi:hypothetical protein